MRSLTRLPAVPGVTAGAANRIGSSRAVRQPVIFQWWIPMRMWRAHEVLVQTTGNANPRDASVSRQVRTSSRHPRRAISISRLVSSGQPEEAKLRDAELRRLIIKAACRRATTVTGRTGEMAEGRSVRTSQDPVVSRCEQ